MVAKLTSELKYWSAVVQGQVRMKDVQEQGEVMWSH